ncbi:MAG: biotin attachment protein [Chloroflexi bacterium]|nr:biotin attachment protein [Chloroflexota bacterium]
MAEISIRFPQFGDISEGRILKWLKNVNDEVKEGEPLVEAETFKAAVQIEAPGTGKLTQILAQPDTMVKVGDILGVISP